MSVTITTAQVNQYRRMIELKHQQMGSKLQGTVRVEQSNAVSHFFDLLGPTEAVENTGRHAPTPLVNSQHARRMASMTDWDWADLIDRQDQVRILVNPQGSYVTNALMSFGRAKDRVIIRAFDATAFEGEKGLTSVPFDTANWEIGGSGIPMSVDLLITAREKFDFFDVPEEGRHIVVSAEQISALLRETETTSSDFTPEVRALYEGKISHFQGFQFHRVSQSLLPYNSGTDRRLCYAWHMNSMGLVTGMMPTVDIGPRRDLRNSQQVYVSMVLGAVRIQDAVLRLDIDQSP